MRNREFTVSMIQSYATDNKLSEEIFTNLFGSLEEAELDEVLVLLDELGIEIVDADRFTTAVSDSHASMSSMFEINRMTKLTNEQLCVLFQQGDRAALDALAMKNERLVYKIAYLVHRDYHPESLEIDDLYIEGNLGLMKAAERFDVTKGYMFSTYACWWIRQAISREVMNSGYTLRLPVHVHEQLSVIRRCASKHKPESVEALQMLLAMEGRSYTLDKLKKYILINEKCTNIVSLNALVGDENDTERIDFIADTADVESDVINMQMSEDIAACFQKLLSERETEVLVKRFGLGNNPAMTLEEIGREAGVTRERIRQIECKALRKLGSSPRAAHLRDYLAA